VSIAVSASEFVGIPLSVQKRGARVEAREAASGENKAQLCSHEKKGQRRRQKKTLNIEVLQRCPKYMQDPLCYTSGIVLISLKCVEKVTQQGDRKRIGGNLSEGQENAGRVAFDTKVKGK